MITYSLAYYPKYWFQSPKIHTDLLWDLTFLFTFIGLAYFVFIFLLKSKLKKKGNSIRDRKKDLGPMISNFLFFQQDTDKEEHQEYITMKIEIRELLKDPLNRKVMSEILMDLRMDLAGEAQQKLFRLYQDLKLHEDAFKKLESWRWEVVSQGILELTEMQVEEAYSFIKKFVNDKRGVIRKQAQLATVSLRHEGINYFLDTARYRISEWQQLKLLDVIRHLEDYQPPRFKNWLTSDNKDVVLFALRLIRYYKQTDANKALVTLLQHSNNEIKSAAIQCINEFGYQEAISTLKSTFSKGNEDIKIQILESIAVLGGVGDLPFLEEVMEKDKSFIVRNKAKGTINSIQPNTVMPSKDLDLSRKTEYHSTTVESDDLSPMISDPTGNDHVDPNLTHHAIEMEPYEENSALEPQENPELTENVENQEQIDPEVYVPSVEYKELLVSFTEVCAPLKRESVSQENIRRPIPQVEVDEPLEEDESVFEVCMFEELSEIFNGNKEENEFANFLPQVVSDEELKQFNDALTDWLRNMEVEVEFVKPHNVNDGPIEIIEYDQDIKDTLNLDFIPLVIEDSMVSQEMSISENSEPEVPSEEVEVQEELLWRLEVPTALEPESEDVSEITDDADPEVIEFLDEECEEDQNTTEIATLLELNFEPGITSDSEETDLQNEWSDATLIERFQENNKSIFEFFFQEYDAESKLIIIKELGEVGEFKEYFFLKSLLEDESPDIRTEAELATAKVRRRLLENEKEPEGWKLVGNSEYKDPEEINEDHPEIPQIHGLNFCPEFNRDDFLMEILEEDERNSLSEHTKNSLRPLSFKGLTALIKNVIHG